MDRKELIYTVNFLKQGVIPLHLAGKRRKKERSRWKKSCREHYVVKCKNESLYHCEECVLLRWKKVTRYSYQVQEEGEQWVNVDDVTRLVNGFEEEVAQEGGGDEGGDEPERVIKDTEKFEFRLPVDAVGKILVLEKLQSHLKKHRVKLLSVVLLANQVKTAFTQFHTNSGHCSWSTLLAKINSSYYFPKKYHKQLQTLFKKCRVCVTLKGKAREPPPAPDCITILEPGAFWQIDHAGPFPEDVKTKAK